MSDVGRDVARWMFDSARCTLFAHALDVVYWTLSNGCSDVGRWTLDVGRWDIGLLGVRRWKLLDVVGRCSTLLERCWTLLDVVGRCWTLLDVRMLDIRRWT